MTAATENALLPAVAPDRGELWPGGANGLGPETVDGLLAWAAQRGASDICLQSGRPAYIEMDGVFRPATAGTAETADLLRISERIYGPTAEGVLRSGRDLDFSWEVRTGSVRRRFRVNAAPVEAWGALALNLTFRSLPGSPPTLRALGVEPELCRAWREPEGLALVTGVPGSGKSTLLAAGIRQLVEEGCGRIQCYEAPIEFVYDELPQAAALVSSSEVGRHCDSFAAGVRSSLRRRPAAVIVGEARDRETIEAVLRAADTGIAVYTTAHTVGVAATLRRLIAELPVERREERAAVLSDTVRWVVSQVLVANPRGGRTALREFLEFDAALRSKLMESPLENWPGLVRNALLERGQTLDAAAFGALQAGTIDRRTWEGIRRRTAGAAE